MEKIGFFGGSFNPPTYAHINIAKTAIKQLRLDKFFFVPVGNSYNKPDLIDEKHRYNMLKIACENEEKLYVEDIELNQKDKLSAIEVFKMIEEKYRANAEIFFVMGADNFVKLPTWNESERLISRYKYIIFERGNFNLQQNIEKNDMLKKNSKNFNILRLDNYNKTSSGIIRDLLQQKKYEECTKFTKPEVVKYIRENELYQ